MFLSLPVHADGPCPPDEVWVEVEGSTALIHHDNALFNCCPEMEIEIVIEEAVIDVFENEILAQCYCVCCFDLTHELDNLAVGTYTVRVWGAYGCETQPCGTAELVVTEDVVDDPSISSAMSSCGGWPLFADGFERGDLSAW